MNKFWYCYVYGGSAPRVRHTSLEEAMAEAKRITESQGKQVEILCCVGVTMVKSEIVPLYDKVQSV